METTKTIPTSTDKVRVTHFEIIPDQRIIKVETYSSLKGYSTKVIKMSDIEPLLSVTQHNIIKGFFRQLAAMVIGVSASDVVGDYNESDSESIMP